MAEDILASERIEIALMRIKSKLESGYRGKPRRKPKYIPCLIKGFEGRWLDRITLDDLSTFFEKEFDNPRKAASTAVSKANAHLYYFGLEIESRRRRGVTSYRFRILQTD